jgi:carbamoyl-phosphate synthase large subunit
MSTRQKLLHVLGGGAWQVPTVRLARALGHRVLVTDVYANRPAYALAHHHEVIDICDRRRTLEAAERYRIDGIVCDTTDVGVPTAAYVAERLGLPGIGLEVAERFTNKFQMRSLTRQAGLPCPAFRLAASPAEARRAAADLGFPLVVKPVDNQSSRGVTRVDGPDSLEQAFLAAREFTRSQSVLLEQFLPGTEVTVEGFCWEGKLHTLGISDKEHFPHRPTVASRLTYPARFAETILARIRETNEQVVRALGLRNGLCHAEYMVDGDRVTLVEIAARGGGSRIASHIAPYLSGINAPAAFIQFALGEPARIAPVNGRRAANLEFFSFPSGRVKAIEGAEEAARLPGVQEVLLEFRPGDVLRPPEDDRSRPGLVVVFGTTREEVLCTTARVKEIVRVQVE